MSDEHREAAVNVCMANTPHTDCYVPDGWLTDHISTVTSGGGAMSDEYLEAAAKRAIELGWTCDGHEPRDDCDICMGLWILHLPELFEVWVGDRELYEKVKVDWPIGPFTEKVDGWVRVSVDVNGFQDTSNYDGTFDGGTDKMEGEPT